MFSFCGDKFTIPNVSKNDKLKHGKQTPKNIGLLAHLEKN